MYSWVTVPRATVGFHIEATWDRKRVGVEVEVGLGVRGDHAGLDGQQGNEGQQRHDDVLEEGERGLWSGRPAAADRPAPGRRPSDPAAAVGEVVVKRR